MEDQPDANLAGDVSAAEMIEYAHSLRCLGSDIVGAASALETLLSTGDVRSACGAAELLSEWGLKLSGRAEQLRDAVVKRARQDAQRLLDETKP
jgi:hypothetical protein